MKRIYLLLFCMLILVPMLSEASRGIMVKLKASEQAGAADVGNVQLYGSSYALVIGNDAYNNGWPRLSGAIKDADMIAKALKAHGFDVSLKKNLTSSQLKIAFEEFFVLKGTDPKARLFVWFAGHGHTLEGEGYLVPVDAPNPNNAAAMFKLKAVSLRNFGIYVRSARAKHAFSVFDSCFSGTVFESQRALPPAAITQATIKPVRQFLTSGDANQKVSDNGTFRKLFIRAIHGASRADANGDGYLTASELGLFMTDKVTNLTHARQTPRYGKLNDLKYDQGDFVFQLPQGSQAAIPVVRPSSNMEATFWNSIKDSSDPAMFKAYLEQYPHGAFASLARLKSGTQVAMTGRPKILDDAPKYGLTIHTTPTDARIRILNIGPKYTAGMLLPSGRYHLSVSKSGFKSQDEWIEIKGKDLAYKITLKASVDAAMQRKVDRYLIAAEDGMDAKDHEAVIKQINKVKALKVSLPVEFHYHLAYAQLEIGDLDAARASAETYLDHTDRKAEFYRKAMRLQSRADKMEEELIAKKKKDKEAVEQLRELRQYGLVLVDIPSGSFQMGNADHSIEYTDSQRPVHTVHINSFKMMTTEVTQGLWQSVMGSNPSKFKGDNNPVERVSWDDIQIFIRKLNGQTGQRFRLPSESEWEYAARAGTTTQWSWGNSDSSAGSYGWDLMNSGFQTHPVGQKQPNGYGLYDMHGNVYEWVQDCWNDNYNDAPTNDSAWLSGFCAGRVLRGGSWDRSPNEISSAHRNRTSTSARSEHFGFRLAQD